MIGPYPKWVQEEGHAGTTAWCEADEQAYIDSCNDRTMPEPVTEQAKSLPPKPLAGKYDQRNGHFDRKRNNDF